MSSILLGSASPDSVTLPHQPGVMSAHLLDGAARTDLLGRPLARNGDPTILVVFGEKELRVEVSAPGTPLPSPCVSEGTQMIVLWHHGGSGRVGFVDEDGDT